MKNKYLILLLLIILVSAAFYISSTNMIDGKVKKIGKLDKKIKKAQEKLNSAKVLNEQLKEVSKVIELSITNVKDYKADEVNSFVKELADMSDDYKIAVYSINPKAVFTNSNSFYVEHEYSMQINCTYVQLGQFLSSLESLDKILKIKTLDVKPIKNKIEYEDEEDTITHYRVTLELLTVKIIKEA